VLFIETLIDWSHPQKNQDGQILQARCNMIHRMLKNSGTETEPQEWNSECWDDVHLLKGVQNAVVDAFYSDYLIGTVAFADR
jgi:hypothetical protein